MSSDFSIKVEGLSKRYEIYDKPADRLKQLVYSGVRRLFKLKEKQYFREHWSLQDVSFEIAKGETVGIVGRNGAGKSTLLQLICGTLNPTNGEIICNGRIAALLELGAGFNPDFTGRENVYMNAAVLGLSEAEIKERYAAIEAFADIGELIEQPVKTYSSGMVVRLAFSVIAHVDADVLVIDEALAVGDVFFTQKCMRFLRDFMETKSVLFVSHDTGAVLNLCDRAVFLEGGKVKRIGAAKDIVGEYLEGLQGVDQTAQDDTALDVPARETFQTAKDERVDMRQQFINASNLRNDLEVFEFNPESDSFGAGGAELLWGSLQDHSGKDLLWGVGGETVSLRLTCFAHEALEDVITGFTIKDRLGQPIISDNSFLSLVGDLPKYAKGDTFYAVFEFVMPILQKGQYTISLAVATGTQNTHIQQHWLHDCILFDAQSSIASGLIGVEMKDIRMGILQNDT